MIKTIDWQTIEDVWKNHLWPNRQSKIETNSAMCYKSGYDMYNMSTTPTFFGYYVNDELAGVNSGHGCNDNMYRSRGLWVFPKYRGSGIGTQLLLATVEQAKIEGYESIWSYPRKTSSKTYQSAGFEITTDWESSETSDDNAYCLIRLSKESLNATV